ncbi:MAG: SDR family NAD(P)-dependent oxidoreductase [Bdellovibrionota bacterium]
MSDGRQTVLITGGAKGIGRAITTKLAAENFQVVVVGRDQAALEELSRSVRGVLTVTADLSKPGAPVEVLRLARDRLNGGFVDHVVSNAGDYGVLGSFVRVDFEAWKKSFDLNFFSHVQLVQEYLKSTASHPVSFRRKIVLMGGSGLGGSKVLPGTAAYGCAKGAINRFVEMIHEEFYPQGVDINCVAPGAVNTGMMDQGLSGGAGADSELTRFSAKIKAQGGDSPELAANMIARLLSPKCDRVSGRLLSAKWDSRFFDDPA